ncbi:AAA family ATPase [Streptantibioticus ferralitis]|uniref:Nuclease SbcCD subunit C n=1 Tax=Streptantibioticus ferralitis TaxID=236510 RepID=A0ABT5ZCG5_9ACTN|nr:SMC family ATPase [Streptantibioticus ferralitis]MDF2261332.1 SMC family ATPase [Streptantibioticus ferralitis]
MRLHRMKVTAFGPYRRTEEIDFDELSSGGIFLLHGATGAGKTSVLDAVCFALYGEVPGVRPRIRLRSDHADPDQLTEVVLELSVGGRRLEVTRRPEQERPKRRGTGTTVDRQFSALRELLPGSGEWTALSRSHQEIGEEIKQLLGMSKEQFCQVVLLPQGDFATFLRADATERGKLLGRLFGTGRFVGAESWLFEQRSAVEGRVRAQDQQLIALAHQMRQAAGQAADELPLPETAPGEPELAAEVLTWAAFARTAAREQEEIADLALSAAESALRETEERLDAARETALLQQRYAEAQARSAELEAGREQYEAASARLERARAAEQVAPALDARDTAEREHRTAEAARQRTAAELPDGPTDADPGQLAQQAGQLREDLGRLDTARRAEQRVSELTAVRGGLDREVADDEEAARDTDAWLADWDQARADHQRRIDTAHEAAQRAVQLAGQLDTARASRDAARRRDQLIAQEGYAAQRLLDARENAATAREQWLELKDRRLRGIAAELAGELADGEPCPVCGSADHPAPAEPGAGHVDRATEERAEADYLRADEARGAAEIELHTLRERLATAREAAGARTAAELADQVAQLEPAHDDARRAAADVRPAREAWELAELEHQRRVDARQAARARAADLLARRESLDAELALLLAQLTEVLNGEGSVGEHASRLERLAAAYTEAADAAKAASGTAHRLVEAQQRLADAACRAGFSTPLEAAEARLDPGELRALRERIEEYQTRQATVAQVLADPDVLAATSLPPADPQRQRAVFDTASGRLREAFAARQAARSRCAELDRLSADAERQTAELAPLREEYARLKRLAELVSGSSAENQYRMRLESYVLAARLEQVASAASIRLRRMSSGRYTLVHTDARISGRGRWGLGLRVVDAWTGTERDTTTLSGGETFFASLALALGLADVVTDEAGGVRLDTLFIDEGFGSLDEQTLDEVLDVLDGLRERDRAVGIVSHVADLRQRIPAQLEVVKGRDGSLVRQRTASPAGVRG